jgi:hypothetical protein
MTIAVLGGSARGLVAARARIAVQVLEAAA